MFQGLLCSVTALKSLRAGVLLLCLVGSSIAMSESVSLTLPNGHVGVGDYRPGETAKPAVLLLHGFLQTHHFGIVQSLADALSNANYPVLTPTLTLGINQRRQSLPCDAIQNHRLADGTPELAAWVQWLKARGHPKIVVAGHSSGAMQVLLYANQAKEEPALVGAVLISMGPFGTWMNQDTTGEELRHAPGRARINARSDMMLRPPVSQSP
ncbi:alpha/beta hydrolase [Rhabdochromatium marinum]|uniref:alpha/beta hydrolase n=1 Tax=Rhabdochromatium marinum TaxID=48729 RepID=UPI001908209E|nr:alpha/beta fold hydrolase [Rhabdochromatium marinum]MBK1650549.1 hypothetical protein [Rhabdochromatium marinum]